MSIRRLSFILLVVVILLIAIGIPINPNEGMNYSISGTVSSDDGPLQGVVMNGLPNNPATTTNKIKISIKT